MTPSGDYHRRYSAALSEPLSSLGTLYSPLQVASAALLGTPIAGCWLLASNFRELGLLDAQRKCFWGGLVGAMALMALAFVFTFDLPDKFLFLYGVLPIGYAVALYQVAEKLQGPTFREHITAGGPKHSSWRVTCIGLAFLAFFCAATFAVFLVLFRLGALQE